MELLALVNRMLQDGTTREEVFAFLEKQARDHPELAGAVHIVEAMIMPLLDQGNVTETFTKALAEVLGLLKSKYGPVSDAPEIGL